MTGLFDQMLDIYRRAGWEMDVHPKKPIGSVTYQGSNGQFVFVASADEPTGVVTVFARTPQACPVARLDAMSTFLHRLNFGLSLGAWVIDRSDGEIRFRVGLDVAGSTLDADQLGAITNFVNLTMDQVVPALSAVIEDGASAETAYSMVYGG